MNPAAETFLEQIKSEGRSSPAGMHWNNFFNFLCSKQQPGQRKPPVPLILAASGASDASKHWRLSEQLRWAEESGCLDDALSFLQFISAEHWNTCSPEQWNQDNYWTPEDFG